MKNDLYSNLITSDTQEPTGKQSSKIVLFGAVFCARFSRASFIVIDILAVNIVCELLCRNRNFFDTLQIKLVVEINDIEVENIYGFCLCCAWNMLCMEYAVASLFAMAWAHEKCLFSGALLCYKCQRHSNVI